MSDKAKSAFEAYKKRKEGKTTTSQTTSQATSKTPSSKAYSAFEEYQKRKNGKSTIDSDYINAFISESNTFFDYIGNEYDRAGYSNSSSLYDYANNKLSELNSRRSNISIWLDGNRDKIGEEAYTSIRDMLDSYDKSSQSILGAFESKKSFYGQFATEDDYNAYAAEQQKQDRYADIAKDKDWASAWASDEALRSSTAEEVNKGKYDKEKAEREAMPLWMRLLSYLGDTGAHDSTLPTYLSSQAIHDMREDDSYKLPTSEWSEDQRRVYDYLRIYGKAGEASEYAISVNNSINQAEKDAYTAAIENFATDNFFSGAASTAGAILSAPLGLADYLADIVEMNARGTITTTGEVSPFEFSQTVTSGISQELNEFGTINEDIPIIGGKGWGDVYGLGTSIAQSALAAYTGGSGQALVTFFGSAAASATDDALSRGATEEQALMYGTAAGLAEALAEQVGVEKLLNIGASYTVKELIVNIAKQAGSEAIEELLTSLANNISDNLILQDNSNFNALVKQYMLQGMSEEEAKKKAWIESAEGVIYDGLAGFVSGGVHAAPHTMVQTVVGNKNASNIYGENAQDLVTEAMAMPEGSESRRLAEAYQKKLDSGKTLTGAELNRLVAANEQAMRSDDASKMTTATEARLTELGEKGDVARIAAALVKQASGEQLSMSERNLIKNSKYATRVASELDPQNIRSGEYTTAWAEKLGTERINPQAYNKALYELAMAQAGVTEASRTPSVAERLSATQSTPTHQIATSESGTTTQVSTGETITIDKNNAIAKNEMVNGELVVYLNTDKGVVKASDVQYASEDEGLLYESFVDMNPAFANAVIKNYDGKTPIQTYIRGMREGIVLYGANNFQAVGVDIAKDSFLADLPQADQDFALKLGRAYAKTRAKKAETAIRTDNKGATGKHTKGRVSFENGAKAQGTAQKQAVTLARHLAAALGTDIVFYDAAKAEKGTRESGAYGYYDKATGTIHLDLQNGLRDKKTIVFTLSHELVHHIKQWSPAKFNAFANFLMEQYAAHGVDTSKLLADKMRDLKTEDADLAYEEMIADACESLLLDSNAVEKLTELAHKDRTLFEKIRDFIRDILNKIRAYYKEMAFQPHSEEGQALRKMQDVMEKIHGMFEDALVAATQNYQAAKELNTEAASMSEDGTIRLQMKQYQQTGRDTLLRYLQEQYGASTAEDLISTIDGIYSVMAEIKKDTALSVFGNWQDTDVELDAAGRPIFTTSINNGDYELNQDFSRVCKKRRQLNFVLNMLAEDPAFEASHLTKDDFVKINKAIKEHGFEIACALCFVDSKRFRQTEWADSFASTWNDILGSMKADDKPLSRFNFATSSANMSDDGITIDPSKPISYRKWSNGKATETRTYSSLDDLLKNDGNANVKTIARLLRDNPSLRHEFRGADIIASDGFDAIQRLAPDVRAILDGWGGSSVPKPSSNDAIYDNSILNIAGYNAEKAFAVGGVRMNSFSDFMAHMFFDYAQAFADLSAKKLPMHSYTKELDFARLFGLTGGKINMSAIAAIRSGATDISKIKGKEAQQAATDFEKSVAGLDISRLAEKLGKDESAITYDDVIENLDDVDYVWADESIDVKSATLLQTGILYDRLTNAQASYCYELIRNGQIEEAFRVAGEENVNRGYAKHLGIITVGVSKAHIIKLLRDPTIRMVIPYHKSGLNPAVAKAMNIAFYDDFTDVQNTSVRRNGNTNGISSDSSKVKGKKLQDFSFYDYFGKTIDGVFYDGKATAAKYIDWCKNGVYDETVGDYVYYFNGGGYILASELHAMGIEVVPKFSEFSYEENYYKLVEDFDCYDTITGEHSSQDAVDLFHDGLPADYKDVLVRALKAEQKVSDDFKEHLDRKGLRDEIMAIVSKRGYKPSDRLLDSPAPTDRYMKQLKKVDPVEPSSDKWSRTHTTEEAKAAYPKLWDVSADESETRNPTQISQTVNTYRKIFDFLKAEGFDGTILDASSGLGFGTKAGIEEYGFDIEDIEPYPDKDYKPKYTDYSKLRKKYDAIISSFVLNVVPQDQRDALVVRMGELLKDGGRMFVNVRSRDVESLAKTGKNIHLGNMEWIETARGSYQKGFTKTELVAYLQDALGDGFTVESTSLQSPVAAIVTKKDSGILYQKKDSEGRTLTAEQEEFFSESKMRDEQGRLLTVYHGTETGGFTVFSKSNSGDGYWFADRNTASSYIDTSDMGARHWSGNGVTSLYAVYLNAKNPLVVDAEGYRAVSIPTDIFPEDGGRKRLYHVDDIALFAKDNGYDGLIVKNVKDYGMYTEESLGAEDVSDLPTGSVYVVFDSKQIKSVDNKKPTSDPDIRYQKKRDADYLDAVNRGDMATAQRMVREAATAAGYDSPMLYHGTDSFGFTEVRTTGVEKGYEWSPFFATNRKQTAGTYTNNANVREISEQMTEEHYERVMDEVNEEINDEIDNFRYLIDRTFSEWYFGQTDNSGLRDDFDNANAEQGYGDGIYDVFEGYIADAYHQHQDSLSDAYEDYDEWIEESEEAQKLINSVLALERLRRKLETLYSAGEGDLGGIYQLYSNTENLFVLEGNGANWNGLRSDKLPPLSRHGKDNVPYKTRDVAEWARANGYDGVLFKDISDSGKYGDAGISDVYVFFNPQAQIKSADPVTYDADGEVIPLSERFNPQDSDIRYQKKRNPSEYAPVFYSQMQRLVEGIKMDKMGASSVVNFLKGKGIRHDEIKWSGIEAFLEGKKSVTKQELLDFLAGSQLEILEQMSDDEEETRWSEYTLDGGSNYRELVFVMPNSSYSNRAMRVHWGQDAEGVLAHARIQDFTTPDGKRMLFVEELQSDWHNEGHAKGYSTEEYEEAKAVYDRLAEDYHKKHRAFNQYVRSSEFRSDPDDVSKKKFDWLRNKMETAEKRMLDAERDLESLKEKGMGDTPNAPFSDTYHEYVMKRLIRMAAEEGYDSIGWTPANIQVDRWSEEFAEGYRIEYDQDIPKFLRKYGKRWGATVGHDSILMGTDPTTYYTEDGKAIDIYDWKQSIRDRFVAQGMSVGQAGNLVRFREDSGTVIAYHYKTGEEFGRIEKQIPRMSVWSMDITDSMQESVLYEGQTMFQKKGVSNRTILANALESTIDTSTPEGQSELQNLRRYQGIIGKVEELEAQRADLSAQAHELRFKKGRTPDETKRMNELQFAAKQAENRIHTYDRQLIRLEAMSPIQSVLQREKEMVRKRTEAKGREALAKAREKAAKTQRELLDRVQESRRKAVEGRRKTELRHKIKGVVDDLNKLLLRPTKDKHIKEGLRKVVADALLAINMDTTGADERVARYNELIAKATDPDVIAELTRTRDRIQLSGERLKDRLDALRLAYEKIENCEDTELMMSYQEVIKNSIQNVSEKVGKTSIRNMTHEQLEMVYELVTMIRKTIRDANKLFKEQKGKTIMQAAEAVNDEVRRVGGEHYKRSIIMSAIQKAGWTLLKPYIAFRTIGSDTLTGLYQNLRAGEDTFYEDVSAAQAFIEAQYEKHGFKSWDMKETKEFTAKSGKTFKLTLEQMMSLYAYSRREQAIAHILEGGIVFEDAVIVEKNKLGVPVKYEVTTKSAFNLSEEILNEIANSLTAEQKAFVEEMQAYLSDTMGAKGNEVSMELLGVKLFKEKFYLPLKSSQFYMNFKPEEAGEVKLKSPAFSKETVPHANNPVVIHNFTDLWAEHVSNMSMYHSFVLALEDFTRVYNYKTKTDAKVETMSTKETIANAYGTGATEYIRNFLRSLNGGVRMETVGYAEALTSLAKKGAVLGSASVAIQQPSAIMRAMAYINPKHFVLTAPKSMALHKHKADWAELKRYAPIAGIKEMGRFDIGMGKGSAEWIKSQKTVMDKVEDVLSVAPAFMDEITWVSIWNAVKRETLSKNPKLNPTSEEFLKIAGERFTEVVSLSQVYDSVFARSDIMRNKSWIAKALTAFMAEPTTTLNMLWDGWVQAKRSGSKGKFAKITASTAGAVLASIVFNSALKAIILAGRDDDEDESYAEKYLEHFFGDLKDNLNPLSLIPYVKDIISIFNGYDVERMDVAIISDLKNAIDAFNSNTKSDYEKWSGLVGAVSALFGIPVKNVERDIRAAINTFFGKKESTTGAGILNAIVEGWTGDTKSNGQQLYEAMLSGDREQIERVKARFKNQTAINSAIRKALRENDPRIKEAAQAVVDEDYDKYTRLANRIINEGHFSEADIVAAIKSEVDAMTKDDDETSESAADKDVSIYEMDYFVSAAASGDTVMAHAIREDIIRTAVANGKDREDAEKSFNTSFQNRIRDEYDNGNLSDSEVVNMLVSYAGKTEKEASSKIQYWDFKQDYPDTYVSEYWIDAYNEEVAGSGVSLELFIDYKNAVKDIEGDGAKARKMQVIDSLPISNAQKDALYFAEGWASSKLWEAPWR